MKFLYAAYLSTIMVTSVISGCFDSQCKQYGKETTCFQVGCKRAGLINECHVNVVSDTLPVEKQPQCTAAYRVPGFIEFCEEMIFNSSSAPAPPVDMNKFSTTKSTNRQTNIPIQKSKFAKDDVCYGTTIIVSVAVGCYLVGTFLTWMMFCCCKLTPCSKETKTTEEILTVSNDTPRRNPLTQGREIGSTSSAQLLFNGSIETLSTHVTSDGRTNNGILTNGIETLPQRSDSSSRIALWASGNRPVYPNLQWTENGRTVYSHARSNITRWPENVYAPISESSSRDYQSILGGSDNPYIPASESSSDYSGIQSHKVTVFRDGEIYQASSESSGNDYTSLKGQRFSSSRVNDSIYYPNSDSSYRDYATLGCDADENANVSEETRSAMKNCTPDHVVFAEKDKAATFNVIALPARSGSRSWRNKDLHDIHEYEVVNDEADLVTKRSVDTLADMCTTNRESVELSTPQPHEYFKLEAM